MARESLIFLLVAVACCTLAVALLFGVLVVASRILAQALMGLLKQLYGEDPENRAGQGHALVKQPPQNEP